MKVRSSAWLIGLLLLAGCPEKDTKSEKEDSSASETNKTAAPANTTAAQAPTAPNPAPAGTTPPANTGAATDTAAPAPGTTGAAPAPGPASIEPKVKAEVDNKPDGVTDGTPIAIPTAKAAIQAAKGWATTPGPITLAKTADDKARLAVTGFGPEGPEKAIPLAAAAAGLKDCQWSPPETVTAGKDKLAASVADGLCSRGAGKAKAAMMAVEGLLVVGTWDDGGDQANVFAAFRSVAKLVQTDSLAACCAAIRQNAKSAPPAQAGLYILAAGTCDSVRRNPGAIAQIKAALRGLNVPSSCR